MWTVHFLHFSWGENFQKRKNKNEDFAIHNFTFLIVWFFLFFVFISFYFLFYCFVFTVLNLRKELHKKLYIQIAFEQKMQKYQNKRDHFYWDLELLLGFKKDFVWESYAPKSFEDSPTL